MINGEKKLKERRKKIKFRNNINVNIYKKPFSKYKNYLLIYLLILQKMNFYYFT